jgi:hypothetical protein
VPTFGFTSIIRTFFDSILKSEAVGKGAPTFAFCMLAPDGACPGNQVFSIFLLEGATKIVVLAKTNDGYNHNYVNNGTGVPGPLIAVFLGVGADDHDMGNRHLAASVIDILDGKRKKSLPDSRFLQVSGDGWQKSGFWFCRLPLRKTAAAFHCLDAVRLLNRERPARSDNDIPLENPKKNSS